jgi:uncharacterized protein (DUF58 family)
VLTERGWWLLATVLGLTFAGLIFSLGVLAWLGLALLLWFGFEWLFFLYRLGRVQAKIQIERTFLDERGQVQTLWAGRTFEVVVRVTLPGERVPFVLASDPVAFSVVHREGATQTDGPLSGTEQLEISYLVECPSAGLARF